MFPGLDNNKISSYNGVFVYYGTPVMHIVLMKLPRYRTALKAFVDTCMILVYKKLNAIETLFTRTFIFNLPKKFQLLFFTEIRNVLFDELLTLIKFNF